MKSFRDAAQLDARGRGNATYVYDTISREHEVSRLPK